MERQRSQRSKKKHNEHLPEPDTVQSFDAAGYKLERYYVRVGNDALSFPRLETKTTRNFCYLWSGRSLTLTEALATARRQLPGLSNAPVYHAGILPGDSLNNTSSSHSPKRIDKMNGNQTLDAAGIKPGDWLLICSHTTSAVLSQKQNASKITHPKHELARKPRLREVPKAMTQVVAEAKPSVLQLLLGQRTNGNDLDKPAVAPLFTIETKEDCSNSDNKKEETIPRRIRGLYILPDDIVDGLEPDRDHAGQYMEMFMIAVRARLALELSIEPKKSKQIVGSGCKGMKPVREQVEEVEDRWLFDLLQEEDWWIPRRRHNYVRLKLGPKAPPSPLVAAYSRDVYCWYPLHRWKMVGIKCPRCNKEGGIRPRQMTDCYNRTWKRVFTQDGGWYFVLSPRVQCRLCEKDLRVNGKKQRKDNTEDQWSWSCTSNSIIEALPELNRLEFPAVLTRQQGIDRAFLDMMRALFNRKVRPKDLANIWLELSTIQYTNYGLRDRRSHTNITGRH